MPLSRDPSDEHQLAFAFLGIDAMRRRRTRDVFLTTLIRELGQVLPVTRHDEDLYDMLGIVHACLACPGAIHLLIDIVERFHPGSRSVRAVRDLITELFPDPLLRPGERRDLYQLAGLLERGGLGPDDLAMLPMLYRRSVGQFGPPLERVAHSIRDVLAQLEEAPAHTDGTQPLLVFAGLLAGRSREPVAADLRAWVERIAGRLGVTVALPRPLPPERSDEEQAYLIVECRPDAADPRGYLTSAWLQFEAEPGTALLREDTPRPLHELPAVLEALLVDDPQVVNRPVHELTIEFVLPRQLIGMPFDQYLYAPGGLRRRLGLDYPVVVRSLERMRSTQLRRNWRRKWDWFRRNPDSGKVTWLAEPRQYEVERLYALLSENSKVCLAMAFPPQGGTDAVDELAVCLQAGTPIVLWCRAGADGSDFAPAVTDLLATDLMSLPHKIKDLRLQAAQKAETSHLGNHLTLVFEDADRLPEPYTRLRPPS